MSFEEKKIKLFEYLIDYASEKMDNSSCNDIPEEYIGLFSSKELAKINEDLHEWNGSDEDEIYDLMYNSDSVMIQYLFRDLVENRGNV